MKAVISTEDMDDKSLIKKAKASPGLVGRDLVKEVTCDELFRWTQSDGKEAAQSTQKKVKPYKVVAIDCGIKYNMLRILDDLGCEVVVVPAKTASKDILFMKPDGVLLSNGPGDPAAVTYVAKNIKGLFGRVPIFGICLGNQLLGMALGGKTYKLKFGHHGGNHPVKDIKTGKISITVQNHGFCVDMDSLKKSEIEITHVNLNDNTLEGMRHKNVPAFSVQFHPECSPGPHDAMYLFNEFVEMMKNA